MIYFQINCYTVRLLKYDEKQNITDANCIGKNWSQGSGCIVSHHAQQTRDELMPLDLAGSAARLVAMAVPATVYQHCGITRQRLTQGFQTSDN